MYIYRYVYPNQVSIGCGIYFRAWSLLWAQYGLSLYLVFGACLVPYTVSVGLYLVPLFRAVYGLCWIVWYIF